MFATVFWEKENVKKGTYEFAWSKFNLTPYNRSARIETQTVLTDVKTWNSLCNFRYRYCLIDFMNSVDGLMYNPCNLIVSYMADLIDIHCVLLGE